MGEFLSFKEKREVGRGVDLLPNKLRDRGAGGAKEKRLRVFRTFLDEGKKTEGG